MQYEKLFKESHAATLPASLKVTSSSDGFRVMDPFDWTMDKNVYQRWQLWSHKARLALDAMEGDTERTKISYLHHWLNGEGIVKIEGWKNSKILLSQADHDTFEDKAGKYSLDKTESYFSFSHTQNCEKMPVSMPGSRRKSSQGYNFYGYEQSMSKGQGNKSHD